MNNFTFPHTHTSFVIHMIKILTSQSLITRFQYILQCKQRVYICNETQAAVPIFIQGTVASLVSITVPKIVQEEKDFN